MDSKKEIEIGDYVIYKDSGEVVCDDVGDPTKVVKFKKKFARDAVMYEDGHFDFLNDIEKASPLLLELL